MDRWPVIMSVFLGIVVQLLTPGSCHNIHKRCKIVEEVVKFRQNFAFSGQLVRVVTREVRYEQCTEERPNCCQHRGCCDERKWKLFVMAIVAAVASLLFLSFTFVCLWSAFFNRKSQKGEAPVSELPHPAEPRYDMKTYLTVAGFDPESIPSQGPNKSSLQPGDSDSDSDSFED